MKRLRKSAALIMAAAMCGCMNPVTSMAEDEVKPYIPAETGIETYEAGNYYVKDLNGSQYEMKFVKPEGMFRLCSDIGEEVFAANLIIPSEFMGVTVKNITYMNKLGEINLPSTIEEIGDSAFSYGVESVNYYYYTKKGELVTEKNTVPPNVKTIGKNAFKGAAMATVKLPEGLESIGEYAFSSANCRITELEIPDTVTETGRNTFSGNSFLETVKLPVNPDYTATSESMFGGCSNLKEITIPENINTIGKSTFRDCTSLEKMILPETVSYVDSSAFSGCTSLDRVYVLNSKCDIYNLGANNTTLSGENTAIYGYKDSTADEYAESNNHEFHVIGDSNEDGKASIADAVLIMQALSNPDEFSISEQGCLNADIANTGDGITTADALWIQEFDIGLHG